MSYKFRSEYILTTEILVKLSLYRDSAAYYFPENACYSLESCARREGGRRVSWLTPQPPASVISDVIFFSL